MPQNNEVCFRSYVEHYLNYSIHLNPLYTDTPLKRTISVVPSVSVLRGCDCTSAEKKAFTTSVINLHPVVDENLVHGLLYFVKVWSFIRVLNPALFHEFPDLLKASYQCCNRWAECWDFAFFHSMDNVYRNENVQLKPCISHLV